MHKVSLDIIALYFVLWLYLHNTKIPGLKGKNPTKLAIGNNIAIITNKCVLCTNNVLNIVVVTREWDWHTTYAHGVGKTGK